LDFIDSKEIPVGGFYERSNKSLDSLKALSLQAFQEGYFSV
jgi:hypothetical protein